MTPLVVCYSAGTLKNHRKCWIYIIYSLWMKSAPMCLLLERVFGHHIDQHGCDTFEIGDFGIHQNQIPNNRNFFRNEKRYTQEKFILFFLCSVDAEKPPKHYFYSYRYKVRASWSQQGFFFWLRGSAGFFFLTSSFILSEQYPRSSASSVVLPVMESVSLLS